MRIIQGELYREKRNKNNEVRRVKEKRKGEKKVRKENEKRKVKVKGRTISLYYDRAVILFYVI